MLWIGRFGLDHSLAGLGQLRLGLENGLQGQRLMARFPKILVKSRISDVSFGK